LGPTVTPRVLELLWKTPEPLSSAASEALFAALKNLKDARAVDPMLKIASEGSLPDRRDALSVLSAIGDIRGLDVALAALSDPSVRLAAIQSLEGFADSRATSALLNCLRDVALPPEERKAAARALIKQSSRDQAASVSILLRDERDLDVRLLLIILLGRIGMQSDIALLESLKVDQREEIVEAISDAVAEIRERVNPQ
jgi:HEAT repeat protein